MRLRFFRPGFFLSITLYLGRRIRVEKLFSVTRFAHPHLQRFGEVHLRFARTWGIPTVTFAYETRCPEWMARLLYKLPSQREAFERALAMQRQQEELKENMARLAAEIQAGRAI